MNVLNNIRTIRTRKGLSQAEVARRYGTSPEFYYRLEKKGLSLTLEQVSKIATALEVPIVELLGLQEGDRQKTVESSDVHDTNSDLLKTQLTEIRTELESLKQKTEDLVKHYNLIEKIVIQKKDNDRKVKIFAKEILSTTNGKETQAKLKKFIDVFFPDTDN